MLPSFLSFSLLFWIPGPEIEMLIEIECDYQNIQMLQDNHKKLHNAVALPTLTSIMNTLTYKEISDYLLQLWLADYRQLFLLSSPIQNYFFAPCSNLFAKQFLFLHSKEQSNNIGKKVWTGKHSKDNKNSCRTCDIFYSC